MPSILTCVLPTLSASRRCSRGALPNSEAPAMVPPPCVRLVNARSSAARETEHADPNRGSKKSDPASARSLHETFSMSYGFVGTGWIISRVGPADAEVAGGTERARRKAWGDPHPARVGSPSPQPGSTRLTAYRGERGGARRTRRTAQERATAGSGRRRKRGTAPSHGVQLGCDGLHTKSGSPKEPASRSRPYGLSPRSPRPSAFSAIRS